MTSKQFLFILLAAFICTLPIFKASNFKIDLQNSSFINKIGRSY
jgi:hypothetical protein